MLKDVEVRRIQKAIKSDDERVPMIFGALGDPRRFRIMKLLMEHRDLCVTEIARIFGISVPAASQQLKVLEVAGLIRRERTGQSICYHIKIADPMVKSILKSLN